MRRFWHRRRQERELADELEFHLAMKERKYQELHGLGPQAASEKARRDFGGFEKWKEVCRDLWRWRLLEEFLRDLALALRMLRKSPVFTAVALATLTLAIGANTAIFSLMNTVMLKALPVPDPQRLVLLRQLPAEANSGYWFSYPIFKELKQQTGNIMRVFAYTGRTLQMRGGDGVEPVAGQLVSGEYFSALRVQPHLGRWIGSSDDQPGTLAAPVAVISDRFWHGRMGSDVHILGRKIVLDKISFTVVGVMPEGFRGINKDSRPDVFIPFELEPAVDAPFNAIGSGYTFWWFQTGARLQDGVSIERANAFFKTKSKELMKPPGGMSFTFNGHKLSELYLAAVPGANGYSYLRLQFQKPLTVLMGVVAIVLLIACLNLATLLMARASSRGREITTRFALGASRGRLLRQLLTESLLLALSGTLLGLAASPALAGFVSSIIAPQHDPQSMRLEVAPDLTVFAFTAAIAILATVLTGTLPALRSTGNGLNASLRDGSATLRGVDRRQLWPRALLSLEVALALVLVTGASLLGYSLVKLHHVPVGFEPKGLVYLPLDMSKQVCTGPARMAVYREIVSDVSRLPGVAHASLTEMIPLQGNSSTESINVPGEKEREVWQNTIGADFFQTMQTPLLAGREFRWEDIEKSGKKAIVNESAAKLLFGEANALGQHLTFDNGKSLVEVVGIVANAKYTTIQEIPPPTVYTPATQDVIPSRSFNILVRFTGNPAPLIAAAGKIVSRVVPDIPTPVALSMEDTLAESMTSERMMAILGMFFGGLALLITGIGLYGTLAYATERRTGEIGIRLALGARPGNVISMVCCENVAIALVGCLLGVAGSVAASKTIASFLYGVSARDPWVFGLAALALLGVAALASLVPAMKAARIDPIAAIRYE